MLNLDNAPKKATNLSLSASTLEKKIRRALRIQWVERNKAAIEQYNARIESEGTFAQQVQEWLVAQGETPSPPDARTAA